MKNIVLDEELQKLSSKLTSEERKIFEKTMKDIQQETMEVNKIEIALRYQELTHKKKQTIVITNRIAGKMSGSTKQMVERVRQILRHGTEAQIERMRKGGKGNSISMIASEMRWKSATLICAQCGKEKSAIQFSNTHNPICVACYQKNKKNLAPAFYQNHLTNISTITYGIPDFANELEVNLKKNSQMIKNMFEIHKDILDKESSHSAINLVLDRYQKTIMQIKEEYLG